MENDLLKDFKKIYSEKNISILDHFTKVFQGKSLTDFIFKNHQKPL